MFQQSAVCALGCDGVRLADSVDLELDFDLLSGPSDRLHSPYVAGADFDVYSIGVDPDDEVGRAEAPLAVRVTSTMAA